MRWLLTLSAVSVAAATFPAQAQPFAEASAKRFLVQKTNVPALLTGYDTRTFSTAKGCLGTEGPLLTETGAPGGNATREIKFVRTASELFERSEMDVSIDVSVRYLGIGADVDTRYREMQEASRSMTDGAFHGYYQYEPGIEWVLNQNLRLTDEAQAAYDQSIATGDLDRFRALCGDAAIVGRERESFVQAIGILRARSDASAEEREAAIDIAAGLSLKAFDAQTEVDVETAEERRTFFETMDVRLSVDTSSDAPGCGGADGLEIEALGEFVNCFAALGSARVSALYVVPYAHLLPDLGPLGPPGHEADLEIILNGLTLFDGALFELSLEDRPSAGQVAKDLREDRDRAARVLRNSWGCLGEFDLGCQNLVAKFDNFPKASRSASRAMAQRLISLNRVCPPQGYKPVVNGNGVLNCMSCEADEIPVFLNGMGGQCDLLAPDPPERGFRLRMDRELATHVMVPGPTGDVAVPGWERPSTCRTRAEAAEGSCGRPRAEAICRGFGLDQPVRFRTRTFSPVHYENGAVCDAKEEAFRPDPVACQTFVFIDCLCPDGLVPREGGIRCGLDVLTQPDGMGLSLGGGGQGDEGTGSVVLQGMELHLPSSNAAPNLPGPSGMTAGGGN